MSPVRAAAIGGSLCGSAALMAYAVRGRSSSLFGPSVYHGDRTRPCIALTFDDGPSESTPQILDLLHRYNAPATFFQCGANVRRLPEIARVVRSSGHEIGNHSYTHPPFYFQSANFIYDEFRRTQDAIEDVVHLTPSLLRAPFGVRWFGFRRMQRHLNLQGVMWTVMSNDWSLPQDGILARVLHAARNGGIVCLHDGRELRKNPGITNTIEAVRRVLPALAARGYHFETVSQILCRTN